MNVGIKLIAEQYVTSRSALLFFVTVWNGHVCYAVGSTTLPSQRAVIPHSRDGLTTHLELCWVGHTCVSPSGLKLTTF